MEDIIRADLLNLKGLQDRGSLFIDRGRSYPDERLVFANHIVYKSNGSEISAAVVLYDNPHSHPVSMKGLEDYLKVFDEIRSGLKDYNALIMFNRHHPLHVGADVRQSYEMLTTNPDWFGWTALRLRKGVELAQSIDDLSKNGLITSYIVSGNNFGLSTEIGLMTLLRIMDSRAIARLSEVNLAIIAGCGGIYFLRRLTTEQNLKAIAMTGDPFTANQLKEMGIVNQVVEIDGKYYSPAGDNVSLAITEDNRTHKILFPATLELVVKALDNPKSVRAEVKNTAIIGEDELRAIIKRRTDMTNYERFRDMTLKQAQENGYTEPPLSLGSVMAMEEFIELTKRLSSEELFNKRDKLLVREALLDLERYWLDKQNVLIGLESVGRKVPIFQQ